jgi:hypothetical protein
MPPVPDVPIGRGCNPLTMEGAKPVPKIGRGSEQFAVPLALTRSNCLHNCAGKACERGQVTLVTLWEVTWSNFQRLEVGIRDGIRAAL